MADIRKREDIAPQYKWDLTHIYADDAAWEAALAQVMADVDAFAAWEGKVASDPRAAIRAYFELDEKLSPVFSYAFLRKETDNGDPVAQTLKGRMMQSSVKLSTTLSFFQPELLEKEGVHLDGNRVDLEKYRWNRITMEMKL